MSKKPWMHATRRTVTDAALGLAKKAARVAIEPSEMMSPLASINQRTTDGFPHGDSATLPGRERGPVGGDRMYLRLSASFRQQGSPAC